jgi:hypothetical protein
MAYEWPPYSLPALPFKDPDHSSLKRVWLPLFPIA